MGLYRNCRPITVDAQQCFQSGTIATDLGFSHVERGDWVIRGEDGESYIVNDEFFQRTFKAIEERGLSCESRGAQAQERDSSDQSFPQSTGRIAGRRAHRHRTRRLARLARKRNLSMH